MKSKLAVPFIAVSCSALIVASTPAQKFGTTRAQSSSATQAAELASQARTVQAGGEFYQNSAGAGQSAGNLFRPNASAPFANFGTPSWFHSPADAELDGSVSRLASQLSEARSDSEKDKIKTQLSELLEKQFDQRQKRHENEIAALEAKVKKLKDLVSKRQENRREIIAKRFEQIQRDTQGLGW